MVVSVCGVCGVCSAWSAAVSCWQPAEHFRFKRPCSQIAAQSSHSSKRRSCSHRGALRHVSHRVMARPCLQRGVQSLQLALARPCWQERSLLRVPRHSRQLERTRSCSHMEPPPHSLQTERFLPCSQMELPPHSLQTACRRPCSQSCLVRAWSQDVAPHSRQGMNCTPQAWHWKRRP